MQMHTMHLTHPPTDPQSPILPPHPNKTHTHIQCLHRFCKGCAAQAVRKFAAVETDTRAALHSRRKQSGGAECPLCRKNIASRRDL